jgi:hypothetical protein
LIFALDDAGAEPAAVGLYLAAQMTGAALYATFFLVAAPVSLLRLGYANIILEMAPDHLRATWVALLGTLLAPLTLLPLVLGIVVTGTPLAIVLVADAVAMAGAVLVSIMLRDPRHGAQGVYIA